MSAPGFTPGPWFAIPTKVRWFGARPPIFDDGLWHIHEEADPEKCEIASIDRGDDHDPPTRKRAEATARLISAAPELYEALANLLARVDEAMSDDPSVSCDAEAHDAAIASARVALAKARGDQP